MKTLIAVLVLAAVVLVSGCTVPMEITSFEECIAAGNPAMESYPRQCHCQGKTFVEEHCSAGPYTLTLETSRQLAETSGSECMVAGTLKENRVCNNYTNTYWMDLEPHTEQPMCNPACVVNLETREVTVNWRCTGVLPPLTPNQCLEAGGRTQNIVGMETPFCYQNETELGPVEGFISPNVCCVPEEETCTKVNTSYTMGLTAARDIAQESECMENGTLTGSYMCNEYTGTWWLDLDTVKEGCSPACVVNVETEEAEINWRCTGLM